MCLFVGLVFVLAFCIMAISTSPSIIIVGAGAAGIAAVSRLYEKGFKNVTVLEAENRIGGRVHSVYFGEAFVDLGGEWCHGEKNNIVYELAKDYNLLKHTAAMPPVRLSSQRELDQNLVDELNDIIENIAENIPERHGEEESIGEYVMKQFNSTIYERFGNDPNSLADAKMFEDVLKSTVLTSEGSFTWFESTAYSDYIVCEGDQNLNWNGFGYKTILDILMKRFPDPTKQLPLSENILLNREVVKITWNDNVKVLCSDNTTYFADHLIFTPSVGVLKEFSDAIFSPPLPKEKQDAIQQIGLQAVMKVLMYYKHRLWDINNLTGFNLIWTEEDKIAAASEFRDGPIKDDMRWVTNIVGFLPGENNPNVLYTWIAGEMVPEIEILPDDTLINGLVYVLNKFFGSKCCRIPPPDDILRTSWYSNPHFKGTYSFQRVDTDKGVNSAEVKLSKPLENRHEHPVVLFAGEATHHAYYSTVHGAIESGYREADRLINFYQK